MIINGLEKITIQDYPEHLACIIFTAGCNFQCPFCQNSSLIKMNQKGLISEDEVLAYLTKRQHILDGVVISGGEPTVQKDLKDFILKVKALKLDVKLDTNGYNPKILQELITSHLIDYVAMDIKNVPEKYELTCGKKIAFAHIAKSINILKNSSLPHEFRTTIIKEEHTLEDIKKIISLIGNDHYYLQNFKESPDVLAKNLHGFSNEELTFIQKELQSTNAIVRGL